MGKRRLDITVQAHIEVHGAAKLALRSLLLGDPEQRRRQKRQTDLDRDYYKRAKAYHTALNEQKLKNARARGIAEGKKLANPPVPFYRKVIGTATTLAGELEKRAPKDSGEFRVNSVFIDPFEAPPKRRKRHRKASRR